MKSKDADNVDANRDPMTGAPGAHPVGTGLGALAGGAAAGAAVGTIASPIGTVVGAAAGAIVGGLAGKAVGEAIDPTIEDKYWNRQYNQEPYYKAGQTYEDYQHAYRTGYEARDRFLGRKFDDIESELRTSYEGGRGTSNLDWLAARPATRAAWDRAHRARNGM